MATLYGWAIETSRQNTINITYFCTWVSNFMRKQMNMQTSYKKISWKFRTVNFGSIEACLPSIWSKWQFRLKHHYYAKVNFDFNQYTLLLRIFISLPTSKHQENSIGKVLRKTGKVNLGTQLIPVCPNFGNLL